jgi:hypothetical protein
VIRGINFIVKLCKTHAFSVPVRSNARLVVVQGGQRRGRICCSWQQATGVVFILSGSSRVAGFVSVIRIAVGCIGLCLVVWSIGRRRVLLRLLRPLTRWCVDHKVEALLRGGKLRNVVLWMRPADMFLHGAVSFLLAVEWWLASPSSRHTIHCHSQCRGGYILGGFDEWRKASQLKRIASKGGGDEGQDVRRCSASYSLIHPGCAVDRRLRCLHP